MEPRDLELTDLERLILERSADTDVTRSNIQVSVATSVMLALLLAGAAYITHSLGALMVVFFAYIAATTWERVTYGKAIIAYKLLLRKLYSHLEPDSQPRAPVAVEHSPASDVNP